MMELIIVVVYVLVVVKIIKNANQERKCDKFFKRLFLEGKLSKKEYKDIKKMTVSQKQRLLDSLYSNLSDEDMSAFMNQMSEQQRLLFQNMNSQQQASFLRQMEMDRLMSTGIEFGGFNSDLNLNPSMLNNHFNDMNNMNHMDHMNSFNNFNNFGGGMGGGMGMF